MTDIADTAATTASSAHCGGEEALRPLSPHLLDDVRKTVEDVRRRLHGAQSTDSANVPMQDLMSKACAERRQRAATARASGAFVPWLALGSNTFSPVATAPVDRLPVPLLSTRLPYYAPPVASPSQADVDEKSEWNASTHVTAPSARESRTARTALNPSPRRHAQTLLASEQARPRARSHHSDPSAPREVTPRGAASPRAVSLSDSALAVVCEQEIAVRDFLRRMNILGASPACDDSTDTVLHDPLYNASAAISLVLCLVDGPAPSSHHLPAAPCAVRVRTVRDAERNYAYLQDLLSSQRSRSTGEALLPATLLSAVSAEACVRRRDPRPMLSLLVYLIAHHLPPPEELPFAAVALTTQTPVDVGDPTWSTTTAHTRAGGGGDALWRAERELCGLLLTYAALPDPETYRLPGDDCVVPGPLDAPFLSSHGGNRELVPRTSEPAALYVPSVFPYLCNGVALVALAKHCVADVLLTDMPPGSASVCANPRTKRSCLANIQWALARLQRLYSGPNALHDDATAEMFFRGYRAGIVALLLSILRCARHGERNGTASPPRSVLAPHAADDPIDAQPASSSRPPSLTRPEDTALDNPAGPASAHGITEPQRWLARALGPDLDYTAEDGSFSSAALRSGAWTEPCHVFSDGVLLSHLLSRLERRRCPSLDRVRPTTKVAAKRFNVGQCLAFLEAEKGLSVNASAVTEGLLAGSLGTVERVIDMLRHTYRAA